MRLNARLVTALVFMAVACSTNPYIAYKSTAAPPVGDFAATGASVPVGVVVGFSTEIQGGDQNGALSAVVDDPTRASVTPTTTQGQFVLIGHASGNTTLRVLVDGKEASTVPVRVFDQAVTDQDGGVVPGFLLGSSSGPCAPGRGPHEFGSSACYGTTDCAFGEVCCLDLSVVPQGICTLAGNCSAQVCADSQECGDAGACSAVGDSGLRACGWNGGM